MVDLTRLRDMTGAIGAAVPEIEPDTHVDTFGQAHNIAANEAAKRLYVIGSRYGIGSGVCAGGKICATYLTGIKSSSTSHILGTTHYSNR